MIFSHRESGGEDVGFFAGWWISEAVLIYGEENISNESVENDSTDLDLLVGTSYSFEMGPIFACEYYYNENGHTGAIHEAFPPIGTANLDDALFRKNYALFQLSDSNIGDSFDYVLRWIQNLDDSSSRVIAILEYEINDNYKIFSIGDIFNGSTNDEFGSLNETVLRWKRFLKLVDQVELKVERVGVLHDRIV
jgi:hypothetical protein